MRSRREFPALWVTVCRTVSLPLTASVDVVHEAYGNAVGRGTIQRIQKGVKPQLASLHKMADKIGVSAKVFLDDEAPTQARQAKPPTLEHALRVVLDELQGLSPSRWVAVRAVLDQVVTRIDLRDEAEDELLHLLTARPDKPRDHA